MDPQYQRVKAIFLAAVERADPAERDAYLDSECGSDAALRLQVEDFFRRHEQAGNFLSPSIARLDAIFPRLSPDVTPCGAVATAPATAHER